MQLFYNNAIKTSDKQFTFNKEESKHIIKVLRKKNGDKIYITNGLGYLFKSVIISDSIKQCTVLIEETEQQPTGRNYQLHLAIAPTKNNDRLEWFIEKATEIGIDEITPILCTNSERSKINIERLNKKIIAALKQSLQYHKPVLHPPQKFSEFITQMRNSKNFIAHCRNGKKKLLPKNLSEDSRFLILIGPEGDFSEKEVQEAIKNSFIPVSLGNTRLRTETAALFAVQWFAVFNLD